MNMTIQGIKQRFGIIGNTASLNNVLSTLMRVAPTDLTILLTGESGVGKEIFAQVIHALSTRKHNDRIAINCGALPPGTINSELFGHEKGSFSGATADRKGFFETVDGGTIFLDEIGEMPLDTQTYLLRVLETGEFIRVGSSVVKKTNVRVVAATNVNLLDKIKKGKFREDLYYRLNTVPIKVPALRERKEDILLLFRKFAVDFAEKYKTSPVRPDDDAKNLLLAYQWPGNIRELKNVAEQASVLSENKQLSAVELLRINPAIANTNRLPAIHKSEAGQQSFEEREILYKLLFDMKNDLNDLKSVVNDVIKSNDLVIDESTARNTKASSFERASFSKSYEHDVEQKKYPADPNKEAYFLAASDEHNRYDEAEVIEESLSLETMEIQYIDKALRKHNGRRRDAAKELGISERTLYRKIKQYNIQE